MTVLSVPSTIMTFFPKCVDWRLVMEKHIASRLRWNGGPTVGRPPLPRPPSQHPRLESDGNLTLLSGWTALEDRLRVGKGWEDLGCLPEIRPEPGSGVVIA